MFLLLQVDRWFESVEHDPEGAGEKQEAQVPLDLAAPGPTGMVVHDAVDQSGRDRHLVIKAELLKRLGEEMLLGNQLFFVERVVAHFNDLKTVLERVDEFISGVAGGDDWDLGEVEAVLELAVDEAPAEQGIDDLEHGGLAEHVTGFVGREFGQFVEDEKEVAAVDLEAEGDDAGPALMYIGSMPKSCSSESGRIDALQKAKAEKFVMVDSGGTS